MARNKFKYTPVQQLGLLIKKFGGKGEPTRDGFVWQGDLTPTPLSNTYRLKINYQKGNYPKVYIVNPKPLPLAEGACKLPHTYDTKRQRICLFKPDLWEWTSSMVIADTIVHWAVLWMFFLGLSFSYQEFENTQAGGGLRIYGSRFMVNEYELRAVGPSLYLQER